MERNVAKVDCEMKVMLAIFLALGLVGRDRSKPYLLTIQC